MALELEAFREEFDSISADFDALLAALSDNQFYWSPDAATWSVAQCLDHLNMTARLMSAAGPSDVLASNGFFQALSPGNRKAFKPVDPVDGKNVGLIQSWRLKGAT